ncbi:hypothetical protein C0583_01785 [Candidatus Parcubacteria bacterium]|nr:MAG: hypothetical protein C0583_01785 [Candidatus Parcubacteria bacterium]
MKEEKDFSNIKDIFASKIKSKKAPVYEWQDLALRIIKDLRVPNDKRSSVFKVCKDFPKQHIINSLNDTKELCHSREKWKYFFKVVNDTD